MQLQELTGTDCGGGAGGMLPVDPFRSLRVHFGMLLGVDDLETLGSYHRGKTWLHTAWLHREGVVWGLGVELDAQRGEIRVLPGLAVDRLGRELHLDAVMCVDVAGWLEQHARELRLGPDGTFDAHVVIQFKSCLTRPVPALVEPCDGTGGTTAYSRVFETAELFLRPGPAPAPAAPPYHRLRVLFALEPPVLRDDQEIVDRRDEILKADPMERPAAWLEAFRDYAALDEIDLAPAATAEDGERTLFPAIDPAPIVLADLRGITLTGKTLAAGQVDVTVRPVLVATSTIQELLCGPPCPGGGAAAARPDLAAYGPRIDPDSVRLVGRRLTFTVSADLLPSTLKAPAVHVGVFGDKTGWSAIGFKATYKQGMVALQLGHAPQGRLLRLVVRGTGDAPVLGRNLVPFAGALDDPANPAGTADDGRDFATMIPLTERS